MIASHLVLIDGQVEIRRMEVDRILSIGGVGHGMQKMCFSHSGSSLYEKRIHIGNVGVFVGYGFGYFDWKRIVFIDHKTVVFYPCRDEPFECSFDMIKEIIIKKSVVFIIDGKKVIYNGIIDENLINCVKQIKSYR